MRIASRLIRRTGKTGFAYPAGLLAVFATVFVLLVLHEIGAHYTYSLVPYDVWLEKVAGISLANSLGFERNHYDRLIHFAYGLLVLWPAVELLRYGAPPRGVWRAILPVLFVISHSALYELIEWVAAVVFGGELGAAYLGTQGDEWDAQKDMAFAASGAVVSMLIAASLRRVCLHRLDKPGHLAAQLP